MAADCRVLQGTPPVAKMRGMIETGDIALRLAHKAGQKQPVARAK